MHARGVPSDRRIGIGVTVSDRTRPGGDRHQRQKHDGDVDRQVFTRERETGFCRRQSGNCCSEAALDCIQAKSGSVAAPYDYPVLEVSSFQLETIEQFHPWIAAVLNVTLDHMDRYESVDDYVAAKANIFSNQVAGDYSLFNLDDVRVANLRGRTKATVLGFSRTGDLLPGVSGVTFLDGDRIVTTVRGPREEICRRSDMRLIGLHNVENVMAAVTYGLLCGCSLDAIRACCGHFPAWNMPLRSSANVEVSVL